ncbi:hypothetical protein SCUP234_08891 [Seiridium cupressi]
MPGYNKEPVRLSGDLPRTIVVARTEPYEFLFQKVTRARVFVNMNNMPDTQECGFTKPDAPIDAFDSWSRQLGLPSYTPAFELPGHKVNGVVADFFFLWLNPDVKLIPDEGEHFFVRIDEVDGHSIWGNGSLLSGEEGGRDDEEKLPMLDSKEHENYEHPLRGEAATDAYCERLSLDKTRMTINYGIDCCVWPHTLNTYTHLRPMARNQVRRQIRSQQAAPNAGSFSFASASASAFTFVAASTAAQSTRANSEEPAGPAAGTGVVLTTVNADQWRKPDNVADDTNFGYRGLSGHQIWCVIIASVRVSKPNFPDDGIGLGEEHAAPVSQRDRDIEHAIKNLKTHDAASLVAPVIEKLQHQMTNNPHQAHYVQGKLSVVPLGYGSLRKAIDNASETFGYRGLSGEQIMLISGEEQRLKRPFFFDKPNV